MAKRSFSCSSNSFPAVADTTGFTTGQFMGVQAGSATTALNVLEISVSGQASASTLGNFLFARNSTAGATLGALASPFSDGALYGVLSSSAQGGTYSNATGTEPQRGATTTYSRLNMSINGFGGIYRWVAAPGEEWNIYGTAAGADSCFSNTSAGSGATCAAGVHIIYENL
jgi:hypothetical protein